MWRLGLNRDDIVAYPNHREAELDEYKQANSDFDAMLQRQKRSAAGDAAPAEAEEAEADRLRAQLRQDLARKLKQDLMAKSQG